MRRLSSLVALCALIALVPVAAVTGSAQAAEGLSGSGTAADPYLIANEADLDTFIAGVNEDAAGTGAAAATYEVTSNIALKSAVPMLRSFSGTLDGGGHTIFNLKLTDVQTAAWSSAGLILENHGTVEKLGFSQSAILGPTSGTDYTQARGTITAYNYGTIDQVYVRGTVAGAFRMGGLVGYVEPGSTVSNSYFIGTIAPGGQACIGGITGASASTAANPATTKNNYASATIATTNNQIGMIAATGASTNVYGNVALGGSLTAANSPANNHRVIGVGVSATLDHDNLALDTLAVTPANMTDTTADGPANGTSKTAAELAELQTYTELGWDTSKVWEMNAVDGRPELKNVPELAELPGTGLLGSGTPADPYEISSEADFDKFVAAVNSGTEFAGASYEVTRNIDLDTPMAMINSFNGTLDGDGHTISNLALAGQPSAAWSSAGLILENHGTVERLGFAASTIAGPGSGTDQTTVRGTVAAYNYGTIDQVYVRGTVAGAFRIGGIVGTVEPGSTVSNSYFVGTISPGGEACIGGIAGASASTTADPATLMNNYASATIATTSNQIGMIAADGTDLSVHGNVALGGSLTAADTPADNHRVIGVGADATLDHDNLSLDTLAVTPTDTTADGPANGTGKTAAELAELQTYTELGWDTSNVWEMNAVDGRPELKGVPEVAGASGDVTYAQADEVHSPDSKTTATVWVDTDGNLGYTASQNGATVIQNSSLGLVIGGTDWGTGVSLGTPKEESADEAYPYLGDHETAYNRFNGLVIPVEKDGSSDLAVEIKVFDTGIAVRYVIDPSLAGQEVSLEDTSFRFDPESLLTYSDAKQAAAAYDLQGTWATNPFSVVGFANLTVLPTIEVAHEGGFANINEADVYGWPTMQLSTTPGGTISTRYPNTDNGRGTFDLRVDREDPETAATGDIYSPYRVVTIAPDLTGLTNSDIPTAVNPPPDPGLFAGDTSWIKGGVATWQYLSGDSSLPDGNSFWSLEGDRAFLDANSKLGIPWVELEQIPNEGTTTEDAFKSLAKMVKYGLEEPNPVHIWLHVNETVDANEADKSFTDTVHYTTPSDAPHDSLANPDLREAWMKAIAKTGVVGLKLDHMYNWTESAGDAYPEIAEAAAKNHLLLIIHDANPPTGLNRTYPNVVAYESVLGVEGGYNALLDTQQPFTRGIADQAADFTPLALSNSGLQRNVTWAHELASTVVYSSPFEQVSDTPMDALPDGAFASLEGSLYRNLPATWKESSVLPQTKIGSVTAVERQSKDGEYWVAVTNGTTAQTLQVPLTFLPDGTTYNAEVWADGSNATSVDHHTEEVDSGDTLEAPLLSGGGYLVRLTTKPVALATPSTYEIADEQHLRLLAEHPGANFDVTADINLTKPWLPVQTFTGEIHGNGHSIGNLNNKALVTRNLGTIDQLNLLNGSLPGTPVISTTKGALYYHVGDAPSEAEIIAASGATVTNGGDLHANLGGVDFTTPGSYHASLTATANGLNAVPVALTVNVSEPRPAAADPTPSPEGTSAAETTTSGAGVQPATAAPPASSVHPAAVKWATTTTMGVESSIPRTATPGNGAQARSRLTITVRSSAARHLKPTGKVSLYDGAKLLCAVRLHGGRATVTVPLLRPGKHRLRAVYQGSPHAQASSSETITVTVKK